ncbi:MAG: DUF1328 domain-containing protein [Bacteroidetes bacterium]|nr:DUF1328 domain-containing protein [Bacteroidota bacterium]
MERWVVIMIVVISITGLFFLLGVTLGAGCILKVLCVILALFFVIALMAGSALTKKK